MKIRRLFVKFQQSFVLILVKSSLNVCINHNGNSNEHITMPTKKHFYSSSCNQFCTVYCTSSSIKKWIAVRSVLCLMQMSPAACHAIGKALHAVRNCQDVLNPLHNSYPRKIKLPHPAECGTQNVFSFHLICRSVT
jgi:hypothetical protein